MAKFFKNPFAMSGDKAAIPEPVQGTGDVSYVEGFGFDYERDLTSDPLAKAIPRDQSNELYYQITLALQQYQTNGFPDFITTADNGGSPYSYGLAAYVRYDDGAGFAVYESIVSSNTSLPTDATKWRKVVPVSPFLTGFVQEYEGNSLPSGWVWANGQTIGNAASGATGRANADTEALFILTWNTFPQSIRPLQNSSGTVVSRGISAAADFAAGRRIPVRDKRDVASIGLSTMGGTTARGLVTASGSGLDPTALGNTGGVQNVTLDSSQIPAHTHGASSLSTNSAGDHSHTFPVYRNGSGQNVVSESQLVPFSTGSTNTAGTHTHSITGTTDSTGGGLAHTNVQPSTVTNFIIKL